jgi:hypothetical protein
MSLLVFVAMANAVVDLYTRGVARAAVDEAARAGAALDATSAECEARARSVLGGAVARGTVRITCEEIDGVMRAEARVALAGWIPGIPSWTFTLRGTVAKETLDLGGAP